MNDYEFSQSLVESSFMDGMHGGADMSSMAELSLKGKESLLAAKSKRRSKKDKVGRNFTCGCGKEYLSYPALYTHIKTKHDGHQPDGTKSHQTSTSKRGRPKKVQIADQKPEDHMKTLSNLESQSYSINILNTTSTNRQEAKNALLEFVVASDLGIIREYHLGGTCEPTDGFYVLHKGEDNKPSFHPFHAIINKLKMEDKPEQFWNNHSCDSVIALYLFCASKIVQSKLYILLGVFFRNLRECLNDHGYQEVESFYKHGHSEDVRANLPQKRSGRDFTEQEDVEYLPLIADKFILDYLPSKCSDFNQEIALDLMYDFCHWLYKRKLTKIKINFNQNQDEDRNVEHNP